MKKLKSVLLITSMMSLLISCKGFSVHRRIYDYLDSTEPITLWGKDVEISYTEELPNKVNSLYEEINTLIKEEKAASNTVVKKISSFYSLINQYNKAYMEADLYACMRLGDEDFALADQIQNEYSDAYYKADEVKKAVVTSEKYRNAYLKTYYPSLEGEELENFIQECMNPSNPEALESEKTMTSLTNKFNAGQITSYEFFDQYIPVANAYAVDKGYDNYLEYAYVNNFGRDYTVNDITSFSEDAVTYFIPLYRKISAETESIADNYTEQEIAVAGNLKDGFLGNNLKTFEKYAKKVGGAFYDNYNYLLDSGNYFFSAVPDSPYTAYSWGSSMFEDYLFFSRNYQDIGTFVHEFGHYNAAYESGAYNYDILETQSQGDEILFSYYLSNLSDVNKNGAHIFEMLNIKNLITSVLSCCWVNEVEQYLFTHEGLTEEEMLNITNEAAAKYGFYNEYDDFSNTYPAICSPGAPGYYISYSVSAMATLSLYALAVDQGFDVAAASYKTIASIGGDKSFEDMIDDANLYNPLTNSGFRSIATALDK